MSIQEKPNMSPIDKPTQLLMNQLCADEQALAQSAEELELRQNEWEQINKQVDALKHAIAVRA